MTNVGTRGARHARELLIQRLIQQFQPGDKLPAEAALARELGVSRNTLREALEELRVRGAVTRTWGVGTFMSHRPATIEYTLSDLVSIRALISASGRHCTEDHQVLGTVTPPEAANAELGLRPGDLCWQTQRRYFADEIPVVTVDEYLRTELDGIATDPDAVGIDLIEYTSAAGLPVAFAELKLHPAAADDKIAARLDVPVGTLLLRTESTYITQAGSPLVYAIGTMRSDILSIRVIRTPPLRP